MAKGKKRKIDAGDVASNRQASYRFELLEVSHVSTGDPDGAGSDTTTRILTKGDVVAPDRWRTVEDYGDGMSDDSKMELIRVGDTMYTGGLDLTGGAGPSWISTLGAFLSGMPLR